MDALCKRLNIDNSKRNKHSALIDCELLKEVYINLIDQKEPKLNLESTEIFNMKINESINKNQRKKRKIVKPTNRELKLHQDYVKHQLKRNFFN